MSLQTVPVLKLSRHIHASAERVFDAWIDPKTAGQWLFACHGKMIRVEIDARAGGRFNFTRRDDTGEEVEHIGEYLAVERPRLIVFTFGVPKFSAESTRVTVEIEPTAPNECDLTLTHEGVEGEWRERTTQGWTSILRNLAGSLAQREDPPAARISADTVRIVRLLPGPIERLWSYLTDSDKRAKWLASGEIPPRAGAAFSLHFVNSELSPEPAVTPAEYADRQGSSSRNEVLRFEPPHCFAMKWFMGECVSEVLFELAAEGDKVRLTVTHSGLPDHETLIEVSAGWHTHLIMLSAVLRSQVPTPFWPIFEQLAEDYAARFPESPAAPARE